MGHWDKENTHLTHIIGLWCVIYIMAVSFIGGENHRPAASHWQTSSHNVVSSTHLAWADTFDRYLFSQNKIEVVNILKIRTTLKHKYYVNWDLRMTLPYTHTLVN